LLVVLDTNIICADFQLNGQAFRVFLETFSKAGNRCVVPAVVLDEIVKAFERQLSDFERKFAGDIPRHGKSFIHTRVGTQQLRSGLR